MPNTVTIRPATLADDAALVDLDLRTWSTLHSVQPEPEQAAGAESFFNERTRPEHVLVAEAGGDLAGYVRVVPATPLASNAHVRQIGGLVVDDRARGRGVARALLHAAADEARRQGATRLTLRVLGHNAPARRLYESEGYVVEGVLRGEFLLDGVAVDDVLMARSLAG
ncbi:GNAT family N-acetyltransferase [Streptomyces pactum]|uniref:GNAT family N-acetyltransferase n=1 Tax=Streptomyces pactum TaxID=68249 RepID=A0ABS0NH17_9ACTN|nr:GNAT family N-acetyltransferase [Streptomyces pactum]MBH5334485.1 GNAT family N-acetyltransferase [Streptomyces pactum]